MPLVMKYVCSCGESWDTSDWSSVTAHIDANPTHVVTEGYTGDGEAGVPPELLVRMPDDTLYSVSNSAIRDIVGTTMQFLREQGENPDNVADGMITEALATTSDLPASPATNPAYAVVLNGATVGRWLVAWWGGTEWQVTEYPWFRPDPPIPGGGQWIIRLDPQVGEGNSSWSYAMGTEVRIKSAADGLQIKSVAARLMSASGTQHAWALRRSTSVGSSPPSLSTYTNVVASGTFTRSTDGAWEAHNLGTPVTVATNEWYVMQVFVGVGGMTASISTARSADLFQETYAQVYAGAYVSRSGPNPGSTAPPTNRSTSTLYGVTSLGIG